MAYSLFSVSEVYISFYIDYGHIMGYTNADYSGQDALQITTKLIAKINELGLFSYI